MSVVKFDHAQFVATFPHLDFSGITPEAIELYWNMAVDFVGNTDGDSFAPYDPEHGIIERRTLLYLALAHLLQMSQASANGSGGGLSGRIASVSEGSVSVSVTPYQAKNSTAEYWLSTNEGALYWQYTAKYRRGGRMYTTNTYHPWV